MLRVALCFGGFGELVGLQRGEGGGDFDDFELRLWIYFRVHVTNVVEDVEH